MESETQKTCLSSCCPPSPVFSFVCSSYWFFVCRVFLLHSLASLSLLSLVMNISFVMLVVILWSIPLEILKEIHRVFFFLLSSNSVTLLIEILLTSALRWCVGVAVRGSVWLVVVLVVVLWVWLGVELKESNAHAHTPN